MTILLLLVFGLFAQAQDETMQSCSLEEIAEGWKTKPIDNVVNGSFAVMLERFDQTWPTWMTRALRTTMKKGLAKEVLEEETALTVIVDARNGYVSVSDAGTDGEYMSACVWNRSNGHRLLAVCMGDPTDPFIEFICFYDYDPHRKILNPEPDILAGFRKWTARNPYYLKLPRKGKNLVIDDWGEDGPLRHTFKWDGMKPVLSKTEPLPDE